MGGRRWRLCPTTGHARCVIRVVCRDRRWRARTSRFCFAIRPGTVVSRINEDKWERIQPWSRHRRIVIDITGIGAYAVRLLQLLGSVGTVTISTLGKVLFDEADIVNHPGNTGR